MKMLPLKAEARSAEILAKIIRREGNVPCVLYGNDTENVSLQCDYSEIYRTYAKAGKSTLVELDAAGKTVPVLFHSIDFEPVSDRITHVDFFAVDMKKEIEASVPLHFVGESEAVKGLGGVMVSVMDHVTVKCLPTALPPSIDVSIEKLVEFTDSITVADIVIPNGVVIQDSKDAMIATVQEPRKEEVIEVAPAEGEEGAEGAEGETSTAEGEAPAEGGEAPAAEGGEAKP
ncbi:MAG: 50S ribosomal protein L25, partial [Candidatus Peribacteraceae bacterium]|nr:50S ribosomal protein L25 [Candidatus Peribacteraceae bacterium]